MGLDEMENSDGVAWAPGKGDDMAAFETPTNERGSEGGSMSGIDWCCGSVKCCGKGGSGGSMPQVALSDGSALGGSRHGETNVPSKSEVAARDDSLFTGLLFGWRLMSFLASGI